MDLPIEIVGRGQRQITFVWEEGDDPSARCTLGARQLRLRCRCALCIEEMTGRQLLDPGKVPDDLSAKELELIGGYGLRITFSDGHSTGIYKFRDLQELCRLQSRPA